MAYKLAAATHVLVWGYPSGIRRCLLLLLGMAGGGGQLTDSPHLLKLCMRTRATSSMGGEMGHTDGPQTVWLSTTFLALFPFPVGKTAPWPCDPVLTQEMCWHHLLSPCSSGTIIGPCACETKWGERELVQRYIHPKLVYLKDKGGTVLPPRFPQRCLPLPGVTRLKFSRAWITLYTFLHTWVGGVTGTPAWTI